MTPFPIHMYTPQSLIPHVYPRPSDDHTLSAGLDCVSLSLQLGPCPQDPDQQAVAQPEVKELCSVLEVLGDRGGSRFLRHSWTPERAKSSARHGDADGASGGSACPHPERAPP